MADTTTSNVQTEPVKTTETVPQSTTAEPSHTNGDSSKPAGPGKRPPPILDATMEANVREILFNARKVANTGTNPFTSDQDVRDLAVVTNSLVQILNANWVATDTVIRSVTYLQGPSHPGSKTALGFARRDRRKELEENKAAEAVLADTTNGGLTEHDDKTSPQSSDATGTTTGSNKEDAAPGTESLPQKTKKKVKNWGRRNNRNRKNSANPKTQEEKAGGQTDGAGKATEVAGGKENVNGHKLDASSDTAVEGEEGVPVQVSA